MRALLVLGFILATICVFGQQNTYSIANGRVHFKSEAPLELIEAESNELKGLIDFDKETFAFSIPISSFRGFNSALQREHFNENYMETEKFPRATFSGKIIEKVDTSKPGTVTVRAKGKFIIHGIEQERIIPATLDIQNGKISLASTFNVVLGDHDIAIPKVVQHKIAEVITVEINAKAEKK
jgi:polyisoprenoid-binding protein YceI